MKKVTAFSVHRTGTGEQAAFTYSEINESTGKIIAQNKRAEVVILEDEILTAVATIYNFLQHKIPE